MDERDREALIDELMALGDFGEAIDEEYVEMAAERCLWLIVAGEYLHGKEEENLEE